jgi:hypothetical protein
MAREDVIGFIVSYVDGPDQAESREEGCTDI